MKRLFNTNFNNASLHFMLLVLRVGIASFMIVHGYQKLGWLMAGGEIQFGDPIGVGMAASLYLAVFAEFFCSIFLLLGLGTRLALIPLIITMVVAVFIVHAPDGFDKKELGLHYLLVYVFLLISGPGKYSIDNIISKRLYSRKR
ncbi:putative oxidoreductase [Pedobacter sp. ok626]|uniref:DoxX family protein n=1 Tax=Pedobacter sp. ok626 TaxID=1761882 RepID=UPI0008915AD2|nr:DoxX family protein [Pedobacter sp. ok626]SDJ12808.1 putative oxidoreductase [Pedobacter sp. ok626]